MLSIWMGTTAYGLVPDNPALHFGAGDFSLEAMVYLESYPTNYDPSIVFKYDSLGYGNRRILGPRNERCDETVSVYWSRWYSGQPGVARCFQYPR